MSVDNIWDNSDADNNANNPNNWSLGRVPTTGDIAYLDATSVANCVFSAGITCDGVNITSAYSGKIDFGDGGYSHSFSGDFIADGTGEMDFGNASIVCSGHFDVEHQVTQTCGTSTVTLNGTSKNYVTAYRKYTFYNLTIEGTITCTGGTSEFINRTLWIKNGGSFDLNSRSFQSQYEVKVEAGGTLTGPTGSMSIAGSAGVSQNDGTWSPASTTFNAVNCPIASGTYDSNVVFGNYLGYGNVFGGDVVFAKNVTFGNYARNYNITISNSTNNPNIEFRGNVSVSSLFSGIGRLIIWNKGTGTITFSGSANQTVDLYNVGVENIIINKDTPAAKVTFTNDFTTDSLTLTQGTLAFGATTVPKTAKTLGDWLINPEFGYVDPTNLGMWKWEVDGLYRSPPVHYGYQSLTVGGSPVVWSARRRLFGLLSTAATIVARLRRPSQIIGSGLGI